MSIPIVPNKNKNLGKTASEEERQLRILEGGGMMSQALDEQIKKMAQNSNWMNKGLQEQAEIEKDIPISSKDIDVLDFPRGMGFGPGPEGGGLGRGRSIPGVPGTGCRSESPYCPLNSDEAAEDGVADNTEDSAAIVVEDEQGEEPEVHVTEDEAVVEEVEESIEATVEGVVTKMEEAILELKGLFEGETGSFDSMEESLEEIRGLIGDVAAEEVQEKIPSIQYGDGEGNEQYLPNNREFQNSIAQDYFGEVPEEERSLEDLNSRIAGHVAPITRKQYVKLAKKYSKKLTKTAQNEAKRSGIPPWQYTALGAYFKATPEAKRSFEDAKKWWQTTNQKGELLKENYEEAQKKFSGNDKKAKLVEIKMDKKASSETDKFVQKFPELRNYSKIGNYNSSGGSKQKVIEAQNSLEDKSYMEREYEEARNSGPSLRGMEEWLDKYIGANNWRKFGGGYDIKKGKSAPYEFVAAVDNELLREVDYVAQTALKRLLNGVYKRLSKKV